MSLLTARLMRSPVRIRTAERRQQMTDTRAYSPRPQRLRWLRPWVRAGGAFVLQVASVGLLIGAWALSNPMFAAPDEDLHLARAQSTWLGDMTPPYSTDGVPVEEVFCMAFQPDVTADCMDLAWGSPTSEQLLPTTDGYPPAFYAVSGAPTRLIGGLGGAYAVRLWLAGLCSVILVAAISRLRALRDDDLGVVALLVALTPMSIFLMSSINPSGLSIALGALAGAAGLTWQMTRSRRELVVLLAAVVGIVVLRRDGPIIGGAILLTFIAPRLWRLRTMGARRPRRATVLGVTVIAAGVLAATWSSWSFIRRQLSHDFTWSNWRGILANVDDYTRQLVGMFGWLDTWVSEATMSMWFLTAGALLAVAVINRMGSGLQGVVLLACCIALPVAFGLFRLPYFQTRYVLPAFVGGLVLLATTGVKDLSGSQTWLRVRRMIAAGVFVTHLTAFLTNMHRYSHGQTEQWSLFASAVWEPPYIGNMGALALGVVGSLAFATLGNKITRRMPL